MPGNPEVVSVLAGGWSARGYDVNRLPGLVIGVNDAAVRARCDYAVSMDRLWVEGRWEQLRALADAGKVNLAYLRRPALKNIPIRPPWLVSFECDHLSVAFTERGTHRLNGTNSGVCALNLAANLKPRRVNLFGFDMCRAGDGSAYWFPPYPWAKPAGATSGGKYQAWAREFASIAVQFEARGIEVVNASPASAISQFPKVDPRSLLI